MFASLRRFVFDLRKADERRGAIADDAVGYEAVAEVVRGQQSVLEDRRHPEEAHDAMDGVKDGDEGHVSDKLPEGESRPVVFEAVEGNVVLVVKFPLAARKPDVVGKRRVTGNGLQDVGAKGDRRFVQQGHDGAFETGLRDFA